MKLILRPIYFYFTQTRARTHMKELYVSMYLFIYVSSYSMQKFLVSPIVNVKSKRVMKCYNPKGRTRDFPPLD
jgi:hypothetical protein